MNQISVMDSHDARYLVVSNAGQTDTFEERMIFRLSHPSLLRPLSESVLSGEGLRYDVTGLQSFSEAYSHKNLTAEDIRQLLESLSEAVKVLESHMLTDGNLLLSPEWIFFEKDRLKFVPVKSDGGDFTERIRVLSDFLFLHSDGEDEATVRLANALLKKIMAGDCRMHDLLGICEGKGKKEKPAEAYVIYPEPRVPSGEEKGNPGPQEQKRLPVFDREEVAGPKEEKKKPDAEKLFGSVAVRMGTDEKTAKGRIFRRTLISLAVEVLLLDAVYFFKGQKVFLRILPAFLIAVLVTGLIGLLSFVSERNKSVNVEKFRPKK